MNRAAYGRALVDRFVVMKQAFFDESSDTEVFLIAGWISDEREWERFNDYWRCALQDAPAISYLKHHEAMSFEGEFTGWTEEDRDAKLMAIAGVLEQCESWGVAGGIKLSTWNKAFEKADASRKELRNVIKFTEPYEACFHGVVSAVLQEEANSKDVVNFIFDEQSGMGKSCIALYEEFKKESGKFDFPPDLLTIAGSIVEATFPR
jgi:hypothetical protein